MPLRTDGHTHTHIHTRWKHYPPFTEFITAASRRIWHAYNMHCETLRGIITAVFYHSCTDRNVQSLTMHKCSTTSLLLLLQCRCPGARELESQHNTTVKPP